MIFRKPLQHTTMVNNRQLISYFQKTEALSRMRWNLNDRSVSPLKKKRNGRTSDRGREKEREGIKRGAPRIGPRKRRQCLRRVGRKRGASGAAAPPAAFLLPARSVIKPKRRRDGRFSAATTSVKRTSVIITPSSRLFIYNTPGSCLLLFLLLVEYQDRLIVKVCQC